MSNRTDKSDWAESKTPRTDAKTNTVQMPISTNEWVTVSVVSSDFAKQLELENASLKRQLYEESQTHSTLLEAAKLDLHDCESQLVETKSKLADYDRLRELLKEAVSIIGVYRHMSLSEEIPSYDFDTKAGMLVDQDIAEALKEK